MGNKNESRTWRHTLRDAHRRFWAVLLTVAMVMQPLPVSAMGEMTEGGKDTSQSQTVKPTQETETMGEEATTTTTSNDVTPTGSDQTPANSEEKTPEDAQAPPQQATPTKSVYDFQNDSLKVTATLEDPAAIPDDATLQVRVIDQAATDKGEYNYGAYLAALNEAAGASAEEPAYTASNTLLYDVAFMRADAEAGEISELQPTTGAVTVRFEFLKQQLSGLGSGNVSDVTVTHLPITNEAKAQTTAKTTDFASADVTIEQIVGDDLSTKGDNELEVRAKNFSAFAIANLAAKPAEAPATEEQPAEPQKDEQTTDEKSEEKTNEKTEDATKQGVEAPSLSVQSAPLAVQANTGCTLTINLDKAGLSTTSADKYWVFVRAKAQDGQYVYYREPLVIGSGETSKTYNVKWMNGNGQEINDGVSIASAADIEPYIVLTNYESPSMNAMVQGTDCDWLSTGAAIKNYRLTTNPFTGDASSGYASTYNLTEIPVSNVVLTPSLILGEAAEYGIVANRYIQNGHTETNFAVNRFSPNGTNIDIGGAGDNTAPFYVGTIDEGKELWISEKTSVDVDVYGPFAEGDPNYNQVYSTLKNQTLTRIHKSESEVADYVGQLISNAQTNALTYGSVINIAPTTDQNHYTLDTTSFPDNTTIYVNADGILNAIAADGGLRIEKNPNQSIVFNIYATSTETSPLNIKKFTVDPHDGAGDVQSFTNETDYSEDGHGTEHNQRVDKVIFEHITFNALNAEYVKLDTAAGLFLLPSAKEVTQDSGAGAGWIVAPGTVNSKAEWHFYRHTRQYKAKGDFTLRADKQLLDANNQVTSYENRNFAFNLYSADQNYTKGTLLESKIANSSTGQLEFTSFRYTHAEVPWSTTKDFYYVIEEVIPDNAKATINSVEVTYKDASPEQKANLANNWTYEGIVYNAAPKKIKVEATNPASEGTQDANITFKIYDETSGTSTEINPGDEAIYNIGHFDNRKATISTPLWVSKAWKQSDPSYQWGDAESITFTLKRVTPGAPMPAEALGRDEESVTVTKAAAGKNFGNIIFTSPGEYKYTVTEQIPSNAKASIHGVAYTYAEAIANERMQASDIEEASWKDENGIIYDATVHNITITYANDTNNNPTLTIVDDKDASVTTARPAVTITNDREKKGSLKIRKALTVARIERNASAAEGDANQELYNKYVTLADGDYLFEISPANRETWAAGGGMHTLHITMTSGLPTKAVVDKGMEDEYETSIDSQGYAELRGLVPGIYLVTENTNGLQQRSIFPASSYQSVVTVESGKTGIATDAKASITNDLHLAGLKIRKIVQQNRSTATPSNSVKPLLAGDYEFTVYKDSACTQVLTDIDDKPVVVTLTINENCDAATSEEITGIVPGTYYIKETKRPTNSRAMPTADPLEITVSHYQTGDRAAIATMVNNLWTGGFEVEKEVKSNKAGDEDVAFEFQATLYNDEARTQVATDITGTFGQMTFENGVSTKFKLKSGEKLTASNLPRGIYYRVVETTDDGFDTTAATVDQIIDEGNISEYNSQNADGVVSLNAVTNFTNTRKTGGFDLSKVLSSGIATDSDQDFVFTIRLSDESIDGVADAKGNYYITLPDGTHPAFTSGSVTVNLRGGQKAEVRNLPVGITYTITEASNNNFNVTTKVNDQVATVEDLAILANTNTKVEFLNSRVPGDLKVYKTVVSSDENDQTKDFKFRVTLNGLTDEAANATYNGVKFTSGSATFTLKGGQVKEITGLPLGASYTVEEYDLESGWQLTKAGETGTISRTVSEARFVNNKDEGGLIVSKTVESTSDDDLVKKFNFKVELHGEGAANVNGTFGTGETAMEFTNGVSTFTLADHEFKLALGLPNGLTYTVTETDANTGHFVTTWEGETGTLVNRNNSLARFYNSRKPADITISKAVVSPVPAEQTALYTFTIQLSEKVNGRYSGVDFADGVATVTVRGGESKKIEKLPEGVTYTVTEATVANFTTKVKVNDGVQETSNVAQGTLETGTKVDFTNERELAPLTINKQVVSDYAADATQDFTFTIALSNTSITGTYSDVEFTNGVSSPITIKGSGSKKIEGLPKGTRYTVIEAVDNRFQTQGQNTTGTLDGTELVAAFTNTRYKGDLQVTKTVESSTPSDKTDKEFNFRVTLEGLTDEAKNKTYGGYQFTNGVAQFTLKDGETASIEGLPVGATYKVEEYKDAEYSAPGAPNGWVVTMTGETVETDTSTGADKAVTGTISTNVSKADFTNTKDEGGFIVYKKVESPVPADKLESRQFSFTVTLQGNDGKAINGPYGDMVFTEGVAKFTLSDGQSKTATGLPKDLEYAVTETLSGADSELFTTTWTGLIEGKNAISDRVNTVTATNSRVRGDLKVEKVVESNQSSDKTRLFDFMVVLGDNTINGEFGDMTFVNGVAKFMLMNGQTKTAGNLLPKGISYVVYEKASATDTASGNNAPVGYTLVKKGDTGVVGSTDSQHQATFTNKRDYTKARVHKVWNDKNNQDAIRPTDINVTLKANGTAIGTVKLNESNKWGQTYDWTAYEKLPTYTDDGTAIAYTWEEEQVSGYSSAQVTTGEANTGYVTTITNTHNPETVKAKVRKAWNDKEDRDKVRPTEIKVKLYATTSPDTSIEWPAATWAAGMKYDGQEVAASWIDQPVEFTFNSTEGWESKLIEGLPKYANVNGKQVAISYEWRESATGDNATNLARYTLSTTTEDISESEVTVGTATTLTNTYSPTETNARVYKVWNDAEDQDNLRPTSITAKLVKTTDTSKPDDQWEDVTWNDGMTFISGTTVDANYGTQHKGAKVTAELSETNKWYAEVTNLPQKDDGVTITYKWLEVEVPAGYEVSYPASGETALTAIQNTHNPKTTKAKVTKVWADDNNRDGVRPQTLEVMLLNAADNKPVNWPSDQTVNGTNYTKGSPILITLSDANKDASGNWTMDKDIEGLPVNQHGSETPLAYRWVEVGATMTDGSSYTVNAEGNALMNAAGAKVYDLTVSTNSTEEGDYAAVGTLTALTNTHQSMPTTAQVKKIWNDDENKDGARPASIVVRLMAGDQVAKKLDGTEVADVTLTGDAWQSEVIDNLPKYNNGTEINYTWKEISATMTDSTVINFMDDTEQQLKQGETVLYKLTSSTKDNTGVITTLTNSHDENKTTTKVVKSWDDNNNQDGVRPTSIDVALLSDSTRTRDTRVRWADGMSIKKKNGSEDTTNKNKQRAGDYILLTLSADNDWYAEVTGLPTNEISGNGQSKQLAYTWRETSATYGTGTDAKSYNFTQEGSTLVLKKDGKLVYTLTSAALNEQNEYVLTNKHEPEKVPASILKEWDDANNQDGVRPEWITVQLTKTVGGTTTNVKWTEGLSMASGKSFTVGQDILLTLDKSTSWADRIEGLPKFENGTEITYGWREVKAKLSSKSGGVEVDFTEDGKIKNGDVVLYTYDSTNSTARSQGAITVLVNKHEPEKTWATVKKVWDNGGDAEHGTVADNWTLVVALLADGVPVRDQNNNVRTVTLNAANPSATIDNLPMYRNEGTKITYAWVEKTDGEAGSVPANFTLTNTKIAENKKEGVQGVVTELTNTYTPDKTSSMALKLWNDKNDRDKKRPVSITVKLQQIVNGVTSDVVWNAGYGYGNDGTYGQGKSGTIEFVLNQQNNWRTQTVTGLPKADGSNNPITYSWVETKAIMSDDGTEKTFDLNGTTWELKDGENVLYTGTALQNGTTTVITNTHDTETTKSKVTKTWDDNNNQDVVRPASLQVVLFAGSNMAQWVDGMTCSWGNALPEGNYVYTTLTPDVNGNWPTAWVDGLPKNENGEAINYHWVEVVVPDDYTHDATNDAQTKEEVGCPFSTALTNHHSPETTEASVLKTWADFEDQDGARPDSITVQLFADAQEINWAKGMTKASDPSFEGEAHTSDKIILTLTKETSWGDQIAGLPKYKNVNGTRTAIQYAWKEISATYGEQTFNFSESAGTTAVDITKDGVTYTYTKDASDMVSGTNTTINNSHEPKTVKAQVEKVWNDADNQDGVRPNDTGLTVRLLANGQQAKWPTAQGGHEAGEDIVITLKSANADTSDSNKWVGPLIENLPQKANGQDIEYTWSEAVPEGYTQGATTTTDIKENDVTVGKVTTLTNFHSTEKTQATVRKTWVDNNNQDGYRPQSLTVRLMVENKPVEWNSNMARVGDASYHGKQVDGKTIVELDLTAATEWTARITGLEKKSGGSDITYSWQEVSATYTNGSTTKTYTYDVKNDKAGLYDGDNLVYAFTAKQPGVGATFSITNTHSLETTETHVHKVWQDNNDQDGIRPANLQVVLLANGNPAWWTTDMLSDSRNSTLAADKAVGDAITATLNEASNWKADVYALPKKANGQDITYTWAETTVPAGYTFVDKGLIKDTTVTPNVDYYTLENTHTPESTEVSVQKIWNDNNDQDGVRPTSIKVNLLADGQAASYADGTPVPEITLTASSDAASNWRATVDNLPKYKIDATNKGGKEIKYTWSEASFTWPADSRASSMSNAEKNALYTKTNVTNGAITTLTNTHAPEPTSASVMKEWDDKDNRDGLRTPVTMTLFADGVSTGKSVTLSDANNWRATIDKLDKYKNGAEIAYTWQESNVSSAYTHDVTQDTTETIDGVTYYKIKNTHEPITTTAKIKKVWNTKNDGNKVKIPTSLTVRLLADGAQAKDKNGNDIPDVTLSASDTEANNWAATVENLPKYKFDETTNRGGAEIVYTWQEVSVPTGFALTGNAKDPSDATLTSITNTFTTGNLQVRKTVNSDFETDKMGAQAKSFHFKVELNDNTVVGTYGTGETAMAFSKQGDKSVAEFDLKNDELRLATDLPAGIEYTVTETSDDNFRTTWNGNTSATTAGTIPADGTSTEECVNTRLKGSFSVKKTVDSLRATDRSNKEFTFTVTLGMLNGSYADLYKTFGDMTFAPASGTGIPTATFTLKDGDIRYARNLPAGVTYTVVETAEDGFATSWTDGVETTLGNSVENTPVFSAATKAYHFINKRITGPLSISKQVISNIPAEATQTFDFTIQLAAADAGVTLDVANKSYAYTVYDANNNTVRTGSVTFDNESKAAVQIAGKQRLVIDELPTAATYNVTEAVDGNVWSTNVTGNNQRISSAGSYVAFTNEHKPGKLVVKKVVDSRIYSDQSNATRFNVKVELKDANDKALKGFSGSYGDMDFTDGVATFTISHNDEVAASNLPAGAKYTVTETDANTGGFVTSYAGETGTIQDITAAPEGATATITNKRTDGALKVTKAVDSPLDADKSANNKFSFTVTLLDDKGSMLQNFGGNFGTFNGKTITFANGIEMFSLSDGETWTADGLPVGVRYKVTETSNDDYNVTWENQEGTIQESNIDTATLVTATNHRLGVLRVTKHLEGVKLDDLTETDRKNTKFTVTGPNDFSATKTLADFDETDTDGAPMWTLTKLELGDYTVTETEVASREYHSVSQTYKVGNESEPTTDKAVANPGNFESAEVKVDVTNTYTRNPVKATILKVWDDEDNTFNKRPVELQVSLNQTVDGVTSKVPGVEEFLTEANNWTYTAEGLPYATEDGQVITYSWAEVEPDDYILANTATETAADGSIAATLTNHKMRGKLRLYKTVHSPKTKLTDEQRKLIAFKVTNQSETFKDLTLMDFTEIRSVEETAPSIDRHQITAEGISAAAEDTSNKTYIATTYMWESDMLDVTGDKDHDT